MPDDADLISPANKEKGQRANLQEDLSETADIVEVGRSPEITPELEGYLERVEKENHFLSDQVVDDQTGQLLVAPSQALKPEIILPLTSVEYHAGLRESVENSWRWLAEWSRRLIKMLGSQVDFKS